MPTAAHKMEPTTAVPILHLAFELGANEWKLGFSTGPGHPPRVRKIQAGNLPGVGGQNPIRPEIIRVSLGEME